MLEPPREMMRDTADKVSVRGYVCSQVGAEYVARAYMIVEDAGEIVFDRLPTAFVMKASHGSGMVKIVHDRRKVPEVQVLTLAKKWLSTRYHKVARELVYKGTKPRVIFEELLLDEEGGVPKDYKMFCFRGVVRVIQVDIDRFNGHKRNLYSCDWESLPFEFAYPRGPEVERPKALATMIRTAEILSRDFEFVRVDLYDLGSRVIVGELTHFPEAGNGRFRPSHYDRWLGAHFGPGEVSGG
jgi:hypothetical protein